ncbi:MAG: RsmB/NOP family class I SAM-dependent RNA methyltransferase [Candidatus Methanomethyliaceae archaeon]|nr:RsmB/NOP family class I SAM-dependent RNA methyltransferase [Candidatus Methanomethyliaceae archaeon]MDW7970473.1 RsmB/NOP family class I SAM-dependent RNA methyltransferase [Nitrososphaerota archaeon]
MLIENLLDYEDNLLRSLIEIYGARLSAIISAISRPPKEYALRVNTLRTDIYKVINEINEMGFNCRASEIIDEAVLVEIKGPYQVEKLGKLVVAKKGAAESVMLGSKLYAPGVLRCEKYRVGEMVRIEDPRGHIVGRGIALMPPKVDDKKKRGLAVDTKESIYRLPPFRETSLYKLGLIREQGIPAMIVSRELEPKKGEIIVDMCAAPGGKTLHIAQLIEDQGRIYAFDNSKDRLMSLIEDAERLGFKSIIPICHDSRFLDVDFPSLKADKVLVDPPCSALGVRPKLYEDSNYKRVLGCAEYQKQFMKVASKIVKKGGIIVYSTCTLTLEENEKIVEFALENLGLELEDQYIKVGEEGFGIKLVQRFNPDKLEMPGYFIAKFVKK